VTASGAFPPIDWDPLAAESRFTHPFDAARFARRVPRAQPVLDLGAGYGRVLAQLHDLGYRRAVGLDRSAAMVRRGRAERPDLDLRLGDGAALPFADGSQGAVVLFAVLTSLPQPESAAALLAEVERVLAPGGLLYLSDVPLQPEAEHRERYRAAPAGTPFGCFVDASGLLFRHHDEAWFQSFEARYEVLERCALAGRSRHGRPLTLRQLWLRRPANPAPGTG
jgi:SAM-dependent methyltransferase